jgi:uncharacterized membrane protein
MSRFNVNLRPDGFGNHRGQLARDNSNEAKGLLIVVAVASWLLPLAIPFILLWRFRRVGAFFIGIPIAYAFIVFSTLITKFFYPFLGPTLEDSEFVLFYFNMAYAMFAVGLVLGLIWLVWSGIRALWRFVARLI